MTDKESISGAESQESESPVEYSIDDLAALTKIPSRTIRFYQSKGALQKPGRRGRKAFYTEAHVDRLELIRTLQERGLRIKAIGDLARRIDAGELALDEWLGLEATLHSRWTPDMPQLCSKDDLKALLGDCRHGMIADLIRLGFIERKSDAYLIDSPTLVLTLAKMEEAGIDLEVAKEILAVGRKQLSKLSHTLTTACVRHAGAGFGQSRSAADLGNTFDASRPLVYALVKTLFAQEMENRLRDLAESGRLVWVTSEHPS